MDSENLDCSTPRRVSARKSKGVTIIQNPIAITNNRNTKRNRHLDVVVGALKN